MDHGRRDGIVPRLVIAALLIGVTPLARAQSAANKPPQTGQTPYSFELSGSNSDNDSQQQLIPGDSWRKSLSVDAKGNIGTFASTDFGGNFTQAWRDPESSFGLTGVSGMKAITDFHFTTHFLGDRIVVSSSRTSSAQGEAPGSRTSIEGASEQFRFKATVLKSDSMTLSLEGGAGRVDSTYWDPTNAAASDPLQRANQSTRQLKSTLGLGRFELSALTRQSDSLASAQPGASLPHETDIGANASVKLADLRTKGSTLSDRALALLPDSIWLGRDEGSLVTGRDYPAASTAKISAGASRNFGPGDLSVSYWRSSVRSGLPAAGADHWDGDGVDVGGNLHFRHWQFSGSMSFYTANNLAAWNNTGENSMSGSLLAKWKPTDGPEFTAGISSYSYGYAMFDYDGLQADNLWRYEFATDLSKLVSAGLNRDIQLKLLTSFQLQSNQSRWGNGLYRNDLGSTFVGLRLGLPQ